MQLRESDSSTQKTVLSVADVAAYLGVCRQTVYNYIYHEGMPSIKIRGMRRVNLNSLHVWLKEREQVLSQKEEYDDNEQATWT